MATQVNFYTTTLAQSLAAGGSDTEIFVNSIQTLDGETISTAIFTALGAGYLTIDPQSTQRVERIKFTSVSSADTSFTGATRGLLNIGGAGASTANAFYHPVGSTVIISFGADDINDLLAYVNNTAFAGAPNASTSVKGIVQLPTQAQVDAKTATGSTSALLALTPDKQRSTLMSDYIVDTGAANAYAIAPSPAIAAYAVGQVFSFKATHANTTASTLNVNSLGTKNIYTSHGGGVPAALVGNEIQVGQVVQVEYDGTEFQMVSPSAVTASVADVTAAIAVGFSALTAPFTAASALAAGPVALGSYSSDGGIGFDLVTSGSLASGNVTVTVGNHSNRKLYFMLPQTTTGLPGITANGAAMTQIVNTTNWGAGGNTNTAIYELVNPSVGSNLIVTGLTTQSYIIYSLYNCAQSAATVFSSAQASSTSSVSTSLTPDTIGSIILAVIGATVAPTLTSALYNQTAPTNSRSGSVLPALATVSNTVSGTFASNNYAGLCILSVKPFVTGALGIVPASSGAVSYLLNSCFGFVTTSYALGATASVVLNGIVTGLSGLTIGSVYYLNDTAGTIGTSAGTNTRKLGIALSATTLYITNEP